MFCKKITNTVNIQVVNIEIIKIVIDFCLVNYLFMKKKTPYDRNDKIDFVYRQLDCLGFIRLIRRIKIEKTR